MRKSIDESRLLWCFAGLTCDASLVDSTFQARPQSNAMGSAYLLLRASESVSHITSLPLWPLLFLRFQPCSYLACLFLVLFRIESIYAHTYEMHALVFVLLLVLCVEAILTAAISVDFLGSPARNSTIDHLSINSSDLSFLKIPTNTTLLRPPYMPTEDAKKFHVPNTMMTMYFHLGFKLDEHAVSKTVNAARDYVVQYIDHGATGELPQRDDPFLEDLGYGAGIMIASVSTCFQRGRLLQACRRSSNLTISPSHNFSSRSFGKADILHSLT